MPDKHRIAIRVVVEFINIIYIVLNDSKKSRSDEDITDPNATI